MRQPSSDWTEFDWELALREGDEFATRYFRLLERFCDLPGANELIARHMGAEFDAAQPDCDVSCDDCSRRWDCELASPLDWTPSEGEGGGAARHDDDGGDKEDGAAEPGDSLFYETDPVFVLLRQAAIGWCNIYAAILPAEARVQGLTVLFHIGRSLANLSYSIDDGLYEQPAASIAFAKRSLAQINKAIGAISQLIQDNPRLEKILSTLRSHLMRANEALIDHLQRCRRERKSGG